MKLQAYKVDDFIKNIPNNITGVLLYGPDRGLAKERQDNVIDVMGLDINDTFNSSRLMGEDVKNDSGIIAGFASQVSLMGGKHLIVLSDADDKSTPAIKEYAGLGADAFLVVVADDLKTTSSLRKLFEAEPNLASLPCYKDDAKMISTILQQSMKENNIDMDRDAFNYAVANMGSDRAFTRMEIEKLVLYAGEEKKLTIDDVTKCMTDSSEHAMDDLIYACANGHLAKIENAINNSLQEGASTIGLLRIMSAHFIKLHRAKVDMNAGKSIDDVSRGVFFKRVNEYKNQLRTWSSLNLLRAIKVLQDCEFALKQTGTIENMTFSKSLYLIGKLANNNKR
ncbi:MAG: DNA polymerase III subunit delta [Alphaproteobacteria bacterium]